MVSLNVSIDFNVKLNSGIETHGSTQIVFRLQEINTRHWQVEQTVRRCVLEYIVGKWKASLPKLKTLHVVFGKVH